MPKMRTARTPSRCLHKTRSAKTIQPASKQLATYETKCPMATAAEDSGNGSGERTQTAGKRRMSPVRDGLRDRPERKPIIMENYYAALNYTETLEHENDHIMVKVHLHGEKETVTINAMIDSGATEDFIDQEVCNKHGIKTIKAKTQEKFTLPTESQALWHQLPIWRKYLWTSTAIGNWQPSKWRTSSTMRSF